jgi:hypothetical protein
MEGGTAIALAMIVLAGGGATGAVMMGDDFGWMGGQHGDMMGLERSEPLPYGGEDGSCYLERGEGYEGCDEGYEECELEEGTGYEQGGGGCCC